MAMERINIMNCILKSSFEVHRLPHGFISKYKNFAVLRAQYLKIFSSFALIQDLDLSLQNLYMEDVTFV